MTKQTIRETTPNRSAAQAHAEALTESADARQKRGQKPRPIVEFPDPLFDEWEDPLTFAEALQLHMRRHGDTCWHLHRSIVRPGEAFNRKTIVVWFNGEKPPRSVQSLEILGRIERRYRLPAGYFKNKLPPTARATRGHIVGDDIGDAERRRLAWHLPDDFNSLPFEKREEIIEWVRRVIISGTTEYRRFQAAASKQRYAIRFPALTGRSSSPAWEAEDEDPDIDDPDLLSGSLDAPANLAAEMEDLVRFKTSTLTDLGFQRNGIWGDETAAQKIEHLGLMFGALSAAPTEGVQGYGLPFTRLTFGLLAFPGVWDWYLRWRERRRGFYDLGGQHAGGRARSNAARNGLASAAPGVSRTRAPHPRPYLRKRDRCGIGRLGWFLRYLLPSSDKPFQGDSARRACASRSLRADHVCA